MSRPASTTPSGIGNSPWPMRSPCPSGGEDVTAMTKQDLEEGRIASELGEMQDKQQAMKLVAELYAKQQKPGTPDLETLLQQQKELLF